MRGYRYEGDFSVAVYEASRSKFIDCSTTYLIKNGEGVLCHAVLTQTASANITFYDGTSDSGTVLSQLKPNIAEGNFLYNLEFGVGLVCKTESADQKLTVIYK